MAHLLLVEDDQSLGETLSERLAKEKYQVTWVRSRTSAEESLNHGRFDLIILDVGLPDGSGLDLAGWLKERTSAPFLFITALNTAENRLRAYEVGGEEVIPKPFHLKELLLRVEHVLSHHAPPRRYSLRGRVIDLEQRSIQAPTGEKQFLNQRDFRLLELLMNRAPHVVSRDEILDTWVGEDAFPSHRVVDNSIVRLRQALEDTEGNFIRSIRGVGYQWVANESEDDNAAEDRK